MRNALVFILLLPLVVQAQPQYILRGSIRDAATSEPLPSANIRVAASSKGTVANAGGLFRLTLSGGTYTIIVSSLAYKPDTLAVNLQANTVLSIALTPAAIVLPEVVVSAEDPAIEIIRRAIANKKKWMDRLHAFTMDAFTRGVLRRDTAIASITESFTKGYWQKGDTLREVVKQKRQTENIKPEFNFASVGRILNFNEDEIRFAGHTFVGPTAVDALEYYDYTLLRTRTSHGRDVFEIRMIPKTKTRPLFEGTINIAGDSYALMGVDVRPNEAFTLPFVKETLLRYRQQFGLYEDSYWMPVDIGIDATLNISLLGFSLPRISFTQTSVITDYAINVQIPDSIFQKPRLTVDSLATAVFDTVQWRQNNVLPLTGEEEEAYATLDSTQTLEKQFQPHGLLAGLGRNAGGALSYIKYLDFSFNRVEGFHLGINVELDSVSRFVHPRGGFAYGFSDRRSKYSVGATLFPSASRALGIGLDVYRSLHHRADAGYYDRLAISLSSLLDKSDYRDYFESQGWRTFLAFAPAALLRMEFSFAREKQRSVQQNTDFSIFSPAQSYRVNPAIDGGTFGIMAVDIRLGEEPVPLDLIRRNSLDLHGESMKRGSSSSNRVWGTGILTVPTFGTSMLVPASFGMRLSAGTAGSNAVPQQFFDLETALSGFASFGVFRGMDVKEFSGTSFVALNIEHNFRSLPFLALGIPFLYKNNIEFVIHGGAAKTWDKNPALMQTGNATPVIFSHAPLKTTRGWYSELGFGFSRLFDLFRADCTWRISRPRNFSFTLGVANLF